MYIYASEQVRPYVYMGIHKTTQELYIGYRELNKLPSHVDLFRYRTSSIIVKPKFDEFEWVVLAEFKIGNDAYDFEQQLIFESWGNPLLLNRSCHYKNHKRFKASKGFKKGPQSEEHRSKLSISHIGKKLGPQSPERKELTSKANKGRKLGPSWNSGIKVGPQSKELIERRIAPLKGRKRATIICEHCGKEGEIGNMKRWHGSNCKQAS